MNKTVPGDVTQLGTAGQAINRNRDRKRTPTALQPSADNLDLTRHSAFTSPRTAINLLIETAKPCGAGWHPAADRQSARRYPKHRRRGMRLALARLFDGTGSTQPERDPTRTASASAGKLP
jgi:hypothetical protein